jgi:hypothetical protein
MLLHHIQVYLAYSLMIIIFRSSDLPNILFKNSPPRLQRWMFPLKDPTISLLRTSAYGAGAGRVPYMSDGVAVLLGLALAPALLLARACPRMACATP